jgi:hypothetical protein
MKRPGSGGPVDPDYGIDEGDAGGGEYPDIGLPEPPPGIWPPLTPEHPWRPLPPGTEHPGGGPVRPGRPTDPDYGVDEGTSPEHPIVLPPGTVWPPLPPSVHGKYLALVLIGGGGKGAHYRYVVIDADERPVDPDYGIDAGGGGSRPSHPIAPGGRPSRPIAPGGRPDQGLPDAPPTAQPKK